MANTGQNPRFLPRLQSREKEHWIVRRDKFGAENEFNRANVEQTPKCVRGNHGCVPRVNNPLGVLAVAADQRATAPPSILPRLQSRERECEEARVEVIASMTMIKHLMRIEMFGEHASVAAVRESVIKFTAAKMRVVIANVHGPDWAST